ncbi:hypothetical protein [Serratia marcescens]
MKSTETEQPKAKSLLQLDQQLCFALYSANLAPDSYTQVAP